MSRRSCACDKRWILSGDRSHSISCNVPFLSILDDVPIGFEYCPSLAPRMATPRSCDAAADVARGCLPSSPRLSHPYHEEAASSLKRLHQPRLPPMDVCARGRRIPRNALSAPFAVLLPLASVVVQRIAAGQRKTTME